MSGEPIKRALYIGDASLEAPGYDVISLETGVSHLNTGFEKGQFDMVAADGVLQRHGLHEVLKCISEWSRILKPGGELHIIAPNLRWAISTLMGKDALGMLPAVFLVMYGSQQNEVEYHKSGFTITILRSLLEEIGYKIKLATIIPWKIKHGEKEMMAERIYLVGVKA